MIFGSGNNGCKYDIALKIVPLGGQGQYTRYGDLCSPQNSQLKKNHWIKIIWTVWDQFSTLPKQDLCRSVRMSAVHYRIFSFRHLDVEWSLWTENTLELLENNCEVAAEAPRKRLDFLFIWGRKCEVILIWIRSKIWSSNLTFLTLILVVAALLRQWDHVRLKEALRGLWWHFFKSLENFIWLDQRTLSVCGWQDNFFF